MLHDLSDPEQYSSRATFADLPSHITPFCCLLDLLLSYACQRLREVFPPLVTFSFWRCLKSREKPLCFMGCCYAKSQPSIDLNGSWIEAVICALLWSELRETPHQQLAHRFPSYTSAPRTPSSHLPACRGKISMEKPPTNESVIFMVSHHTE